MYLDVLLLYKCISWRLSIHWWLEFHWRLGINSIQKWGIISNVFSKSIDHQVLTHTVQKSSCQIISYFSISSTIKTIPRLILSRNVSNSIRKPILIVHIKRSCMWLLNMHGETAITIWEHSANFLKNTIDKWKEERKQRLSLCSI